MLRDYGALEEIRFGPLARILLTLLDFEGESSTPSIAEILRRAGVDESFFLSDVKDKLVRAGLVVEETVTIFSIRTLRLTERGRRLAECLKPCRDMLGPQHAMPSHAKP